jgi:hypothetical protein
MSYKIKGPAVAAVGWIPFDRNFVGMNRCGFHEYADRHHFMRRKAVIAAFELLFLSGNEPPPPALFSDIGEFYSFLATKNYRGALCLSDVVLACDDNGNAIDVTWNALNDKRNVGFTCYPTGLSRYFARGEGFVSPLTPLLTQDGAQLSQSVFFRVGRMGNLTGTILTGMSAPYAWMSYIYNIGTNGLVRISFNGSFIPSQVYYQTWQRVKDHSIHSNSADEIDDFLRAGAAAPGPARKFCTLNAAGIRV